MRRSRQLLLISVGCAGIVMFLLLSIVIASHLLANRERVKAFIVAKTAQATGGDLDYTRLDISFFPLPHLVARGVHLRQPQLFDLRAKRLAVYPRLLSIIMGHLSIRRLSLDEPQARLHLSAAERQGPTAEPAHRLPIQGLTQAVGGLFKILSAIDPGAALIIRQGEATIDGAGMPRIKISDINADAHNDLLQLQLQISCSSALFGRLSAEATATPEAAKASGELSLSGLNLGMLLGDANLPGEVAVAGSKAVLRLGFRIDGVDNIGADIDLKTPALTVMRQQRRLDLTGVRMAGSASLTADRLSLTVDALESRKPALTLSAGATFDRKSGNGHPALKLHAAAEELDIATAGEATLAVAGDLPSIRTAFDVARAGRLTGATYTASFSRGEAGWHVEHMQATGHLSQGHITIPGIDSDITAAAGEVAYADEHVDFHKFSGGFQGATFNDLEAAIDWAKASTLSITAPSATVDLPPFYDWLCGFPPLAPAREVMRTVTGRVTLSHLAIDGPLTQPDQWTLAAAGAPEAVHVKSPRLPFELTLSDGRINYRNGAMEASDVHLAFLDADVTASYRADHITTPQSIDCRVTGSLGGAAADWVGNRLSIPPSWRIKPPVALSDVRVAWEHGGPLALSGELRADTGVRLTADAAGTRQAWEIHNLTISDDHATATVSARRSADAVELAFAGDLDGQTVDGLLAANTILSGRITGDFRSRIVPGPPLSAATFSGRLAASGLHFNPQPDFPVDVTRLSLLGEETRLTVESSELVVDHHHLELSGWLTSENGRPVVDLSVAADRLDDGFLRSLQTLAPQAPPDAASGGDASPTAPRGDIRLKTEAFTLDDYTWTPVTADIRFEGPRIDVQVSEAELCGISTTGWLASTPQGLSFHITPVAKDASLQESIRCLQSRPVAARASFDLSGEVDLPPTQGDITRALTGRLTFSSQDGIIHYSSVLMKIFSLLNITELFTGGKSDLGEAGYGYASATATASIRDGRVQLEQILLDGNSLTLTGEGAIDLMHKTVDVTLLAAPLKTIDRIVGKLPIINYITGGRLVSVPLRVHGSLTDPSVVPLAPSAVGKSLLNLMGRTLKSPFKLVEGAVNLATPSSKDASSASGSPLPPTPPKESP